MMMVKLTARARELGRAQLLALELAQNARVPLNFRIQDLNHEKTFVSWPTSSPIFSFCVEGLRGLLASVKNEFATLNEKATSAKYLCE